MPTTAVWCTVSTSEYRLLPYTMRGLLLHPAVTLVLVVHTGRRIAPGGGSLADRFDKVEELHQDFGEGYHRRLEDGGYDQRSARNHALDVLARSGVDWLVQVDADEYLAPSLISRIAELNDRYDIVCCSRYTLTSPREYWYERTLVRAVKNVPMVNPQTRIWRRELNKRFDLCPTASVRYANATRHCGVRFDHHPHWRALAIDDPFLLVHFHRLLGKEESHRRVRSLPLPLGAAPELERCIYDLTADGMIRESHDIPDPSAI